MNEVHMIRCLLCGFEKCDQIYPTAGRDVYWHCRNCHLRFLDPKYHLPENEELERYKLHTNDPLDQRHQRFLQPLIDQVVSRFPINSCGLDFGCGPNSTVGFVLKAENYKMQFYDPFFCNESSVLVGPYDFIVICEALEHFYQPMKDLTLIKSLVRKGGALIISTQLYTEDLDFKNWYYRRDPTHVCFYSAETLHWIKEKRSFPSLEILGKNLVVLTN